MCSKPAVEKGISEMTDAEWAAYKAAAARRLQAWQRARRGQVPLAG